MYVKCTDCVCRLSPVPVTTTVSPNLAQRLAGGGGQHLLISRLGLRNSHVSPNVWPRLIITFVFFFNWTHCVKASQSPLLKILGIDGTRPHAWKQNRFLQVTRQRPRVKARMYTCIITCSVTVQWHTELIVSSFFHFVFLKFHLDGRSAKKDTRLLKSLWDAARHHLSGKTLSE